MWLSKKILVWLSGWVDSAVVAYLLKEKGYDVTAGFMINYIAPEGEICPTLSDIEVAKQVAKYLDIPFFTFDYRDEYKEKVLNYMYETYKKWITPNPDIMCNSEIKFKVFLDEALSLWFDGVATGHYARIQEKDLWSQKIYKLLKWLDSSKDQSYFLSWLSQHQLSRSLFPIWDLQKSEVRKIAIQAGLPNAQRKESQGICFVWKIDMMDFLQKKIPHQTGDIVDIHGNILGQHKGVWYYTIGQRKWLDVWGMPEAIFVMKKDIKNNILVVGYKEDTQLFSDNLYTEDIHFLWQKIYFPIHAHAKIRYRQADQECKISVIDDCKNLPWIISWAKYHVQFIHPQRAIAPGQSIVFYDGDELWGSALIL